MITDLLVMISVQNLQDPAFSWVDSVSPDLSIVATLAQAVGSEPDVR